MVFIVVNWGENLRKATELVLIGISLLTFEYDEQYDDNH